MKLVIEQDGGKIVAIGRDYVKISDTYIRGTPNFRMPGLDVVEVECVPARVQVNVDKYIDGEFVYENPSDDERITALETENAALQETVDLLTIALLEG